MMALSRLFCAKLAVGSCRNSVVSSLSYKSSARCVVRQPFCQLIRANSSNAVKERSQRVVGWWLLGCTGMVFGAVTLGGVTRLTESGLSMVDWRLLGRAWPSCEQQWQAEFAKYTSSPEFQLKNAEISMADFKFIWLMEYGHRMWGRLVGVAFAVPAAYFWYRGYFSASMRRRVPLFGALILFQGLLGWFMVRSGLEPDNFRGPSDVPRVSQYRLAAHLGAAFVLASLLLYNGLQHIWPVAPASAAVPGVAARRFRWLAHSSKGLVFLVALSGAFVAGLDAGLVYNEFPRMGLGLVPCDLWALKPLPVNITENPTTVQFNHRWLGLTAFAVVHATWLAAARVPLSSRARLCCHLVLAMTYVQVALGISTLVRYVPTPLAAAHQTGALTLLSLCVWLTHEARAFKYVPK